MTKNTKLFRKHPNNHISYPSNSVCAAFRAFAFILSTCNSKFLIFSLASLSSVVIRAFSSFKPDCTKHRLSVTKKKWLYTDKKLDLHQPGLKIESG